MPPWNSAKAKVQLRLSVQRLRILQQKKEAQAKSSRRDIASLLERGKIETARVKVENIINEDIHVELLELLELYCELLIARFGLLDQNARDPDPGVSEGICAIIYAAPRTELKELHILRDILMHKYGREFSAAVMENRDGIVTERVSRKLTIATPSPELVDAYLTEIAKAYSVNWSAAPLGTTGGDDGADGGAKELAKEKASSSESPALDTLGPSTGGRRTPKLPDIPPTEDEAGAKGRPAATTKSPTPPPMYRAPPEDDFEALTRRFEALKKR